MKEQILKNFCILITLYKKAKKNKLVNLHNEKTFISNKNNEVSYKDLIFERVVQNSIDWA